MSPSTNFLPLKQHWPDLFEFGADAEKYLRDDPSVTAVKIRCFAERLVQLVYKRFEIPTIPNAKLADLINSHHFKDSVDKAVFLKLNAIRLNGNKAAHGKPVSSGDAEWLIKEAYQLGQWLCKTFKVAFGPTYPAFIPPHQQIQERENKPSNEGPLKQQLSDALKELQALQEAECSRQQELDELQAELNEVKLSQLRESSAEATATIDFDEEDTIRRISIYDVFAEYELTNCQEALIKRLDQFLSSRTEGLFLLKGYAGTGKTFITKGLTEYFAAMGRNYVLAAPTGKASKVIAEKTQSSAYTIHKTIYAFNDIEEYRVKELDGSETYKFYYKLAVNEHSVDTVYIIDEASMVSDVYQEQEFFRFGSGYLLQDFLKYVNLDHNDHRKKVIFIGDDAQLPPVGMNTSPALDASYLQKKYGIPSAQHQLQEVVRQKSNSGVLHNSIALREAISAGKFNKLKMDVSTEDIRPLDHKDFISEYLRTCKGRIGPHSIVIAYSNADVAAYNSRIREHFFPNSQEIAVGDKVMATSNSYQKGLFISNGDFGQVRKVLGPVDSRTITLRSKNSTTGVVENTAITIGFRDLEVAFRDLDGAVHTFEAKIFEPLLYSNKPTLSSDESKALYVDFCIRNSDLKHKSLEFKETLRGDPYFNALRLKFGYAITCHKAQGSEWPSVFVKCKSHQNQLTADYFRWLYTAITRTSDKLYLLDAPNIAVGDGIKPVTPPMIWPDIGEIPPTEHQSEHSDVHQLEPKDFQGSGDGASTFGIPSTMKSLISILDAVRELTRTTGAEICDVIHNQYQEGYIFRKNNEFVRINIAYNAKQQVRSVQSTSVSELASQLLECLSSMSGKRISTEYSGDPVTVVFHDGFKNDFHERLTKILEPHNFSIAGVEERDWAQRYTFSRGTEIAVFDIFYNGKQQFKKFMLMRASSNSPALASQVELAITEGMSP